MNKLIHDFRMYALKTNAAKLIILLAIIGVDVGLWFCDGVKNTELGQRFSPLFAAVLLISGFLFVYLIVTQLFIDPNRLKGHLGNLPADDREQLLADYAAAGAPENGRFFLSKFMLYFTYGGGIMRYSIINRISVYPKGLWIESLSRSVLLKTAPAEDRSALMYKLIDLTNIGREADDDDDDDDKDGEITVDAEEESSGE